MQASAVAVPRVASTVAILRDGAAGVDVWLMRRQATMAFAAGMQAFPGGAVEDADHDPSIPWAGGIRAAAAVLGTSEDVGRALLSAAVRETFEECGALYARTSDGGEPQGAFEAQREALLDGTLGWSAFLADAGLAIDPSTFVVWSRWITPDWSPRRFDAYFFLAAAPTGTEPRWIDGEADQAGWSGARAAVLAHERGDLPMLPPTIETLRDLARYRSVADALADGPAQVTTADG